MKKLMCLVSVVILLSSNMTVWAGEPRDAEYRKIMQEINEEYNLNLGYVEIDPEAISLSEYEDILREVASDQKELYDLIAQREEHLVSEQSIEGFAMAAVTKTVTKGVLGGYENMFEVTATYDVSGTTISNPRSIKLSATMAASALRFRYSPNSGYPTTSIIDSGRTLAVTYYGTFSTPEFTVSNVLFYTEFYYDS